MHTMGITTRWRQMSTIPADWQSTESKGMNTHTLGLKKDFPRLLTPSYFTLFPQRNNRFGASFIPEHKWDYVIPRD